MAEAEDADEGHSVAVWLLVALAVLVFLVIATVIGAAVIGSFVLGVGDAPESTPPTVTFSIQGSDPVTVVHDGGDAMDAENVVIVLNGEGVGTWASLSSGSVEEVTAGDEVSVPSAGEGDTIAVVWTGGDDRFTLVELPVREA